MLRRKPSTQTQHDSSWVEAGKYNMTVLRQHKKPLGRQIQESTEIETSKSDIILNSKVEYNGSRVPKIILEEGARIISNEYPGHQQPPDELQQQQVQPQPRSLEIGPDRESEAWTKMVKA